MKKVVSLLIVIAIVAVFLTSSVLAAEDPQIVISSIAADGGETISLTVSIENNVGITNGKLDIVYDAAQFELVEIDTYTGLLQGKMCMTNGNAMNFMSVVDIKDDGVLFTVKLKVKDNAVAGDHAVSVAVDYIDSNSQSSIPHTVKAGAVHVCQMTDVAAVAPGCTTAGNAAHRKCACDKLYVDGLEVSADSLIIPAVGHSYGEPSFAWAEDHTCKAQLPCTVCGVVESVDCQVTAQTTAPTCAAEGKTVYTATVTVADKAYTDTREVILDKLTTHTDADGNILCDICGFLMGEVKVEVKEEITDEDLPEEIKETEFNTVEKIQEEMVVQIQDKLEEMIEDSGITGEVEIQIKPENTHLVEVVLTYTDSEGKLQEADKEHFPDDGKLTVTLPVPEGTNPETHKYHVAHMFTTSAFGKTPGDVEIFTDLKAEPDGNGGWCISFEVTGLSPIMICTEERGVMGDVNGDGKVNTVDAKLIMRYELRLIGDSDLKLAFADVNGDGRVNTADAKLVMQLELGLITEFPSAKKE